MKVNNENFDKVLNKLVASTRSPRGRFTAENSWRLLESRLLKRRSMKRFWMRTASAAAVVLLCVTSWAAYQFLYDHHGKPFPQKPYILPRKPK